MGCRQTVEFRNTHDRELRDFRVGSVTLHLRAYRGLGETKFTTTGHTGQIIIVYAHNTGSA
jgi:hypothetical protein